MPRDALDSLNSFLATQEMRDQKFFKPDRSFESANTQFALTSLSAFQSEFTYLIANTQFIARKITERAFVHLQRSIVVDDEIRRPIIVAFLNKNFAGLIIFFNEIGSAFK